MRNKAIRSLRNTEYKDNETEEMKVRSCLLEYGETFSMMQSTNAFTFSDHTKSYTDDIRNKDILTIIENSGIDVTSTTVPSKFDKKLSQVTKEALREETVMSQKAGVEEAILMQKMAALSVTDEASIVSVAQVRSLVMNSVDDAAAVSRLYETEMNQCIQLLEESIASGKFGASAAYERQKAILTHQRKELETRAEKITTQWIEQTQRKQLLEEELNDAIAYQQELKAQQLKLTELETATSKQAELRELRRLMELIERLNNEALAFKESCKQQLHELNLAINALESGGAGAGTDAKEESRLKEVEQMHEKVHHLYIFGALNIIMCGEVFI